MSDNTLTPTVTGTGASTDVRLHADLTDAYSDNDDAVHSWVRDVEFVNGTLHVQDTCSVAPGIASAFQVNVPVRPTDHGDGTIDAGGLRIATSPTSVVRLVDMTTQALDAEGHSDFDSGWRVDISNADGSCGFDVTLTPQ
jgi:hypothetical protein